MAFMHDQQVVQPFLPHSAHPPLRVGIGVRRALGRVNGLDPESRTHHSRAGRNLRLTVMHHTTHLLSFLLEFPRASAAPVASPRLLSAKVVQPATWILRVPISRKKRTDSVFTPSVSTVKKSHESRCCLCWRRKARHVLLCWTRLRRSGNSLPFEDSADGRAPHTITELEELSFNVALSRAWVLFG